MWNSNCPYSVLAIRKVSALIQKTCIVLEPVGVPVDEEKAGKLGILQQNYGSRPIRMILPTRNTLNASGTSLDGVGTGGIMKDKT